MNLTMGRLLFDNDFTDFLTFGDTSIITMYALFLILGIVAATFLCFTEAKKMGIAKSHIIDGLIVCLPLSLVLGRLFFAFFNWGAVFSKDDGSPLLGFGDHFSQLIDIQDGVLVPAILLVVSVFIIFKSKKIKISEFKLFDSVIPAILLVQVFGRFGNAFGGGDYGHETTAKFLGGFLTDFFVEKCNIGGTYFHPIFLYEGAWLALGLIILMVLKRMKIKLQVGDVIGLYLVWYGFGNAVLVQPWLFDFSVMGLIMSILMFIGGIVFLVVKHLKYSQKSYFESLNEIREKSLQCYVFDLDQTIIKADNLVNAAYGETLTKNHGLTVYDDPQIALDGERLKRYVQFTKEHHELLTEMYRGVNVTFGEIKKQGNEIIIISKLPADVIALKIHHYGLSKYVDRFINSNDIAKLGRQYNPFSIMVFSSDRKVLNYATRNGFKTAYAKYANEDTTGVVCDEVLNQFADAMYLV